MSKFVTKCLVSLAGLAMLAASAYAQAPAPTLARDIATARGGSPRLLVTSRSISAGSQLDDRFTQNGDNMSPGLTWNKGPNGTQSYAVIAEDASASRDGQPIVHWIIYNIPSTSVTLPQNVPNDPTLENGAAQGKNITGNIGYVGPKPPAGETHTYVFQVFALNTRLNIDPANADRMTVLNAMKNRVLAQGSVIATYTGK